MSELAVLMIFGFGGLFLIALVAAFLKIPFKAGMKTGGHEISLELNPPAGVAKLKNPSSTHL